MGKITASRESLRPDPKYQSLLAGKFINCLMYDGKKSTAQSVFYDALDIIAEKMTDRPSIEVFEQAVENVKPFIEVRSKARGWCFVPSADASQPSAAAVLGHPLVAIGHSRKEGRAIHLKLADELLAAYRKEGTAMSRRENTHRMADANKAFAHFAW